MSRGVCLLVAVALFFCSCERRPLFDPEEAAVIKVRLVTDSINNVTCNIYNPDVERPAITSDMLRVLIYDPSGAPVLSQGFISNKIVDDDGYEVINGPVEITAGYYKVLSYNFDLDYTRVTDEYNFSAVRAHTIEVPSTFKTRFGTRADDLGPVYYPPEHVMVARDPSLHAYPHDGILSIEMDAFTVVDTYYIQIPITGSDYMAQNAAGQAVLSGLSPYNFIGENVRESDTFSSVYFELKRGTDPHVPQGENNNVLCAVFNTFGKIPDVDSELTITLSVLTKDGQTHQKVIDMNPVFDTEDARKRHWLLIDEVWELPEPIVDGSGGGLMPSVDDWGDIEETIPIGPGR